MYYYYDIILYRYITTIRVLLIEIDSVRLIQYKEMKFLEIINSPIWKKNHPKILFLQKISLFIIVNCIWNQTKTQCYHLQYSSTIPYSITKYMKHNP